MAATMVTSFFRDPPRSDFGSLTTPNLEIGWDDRDIAIRLSQIARAWTDSRRRIRNALVAPSVRRGQPLMLLDKSAVAGVVVHHMQSLGAVWIP